MDALPCSKKGFKPRIRVKNPGTDSTFESLKNFKRDLNLLEKFEKFSKIPS
jgi:hypothetical protein